ncbi:MAG TPA: nucleoside triphosphate pyrophosphohydrolase, partial [Aestuariivirgaceae bacterium]|nr:nucleoside triphosphate pyrophosphohydrolase [Aestuariivirgaceae bacterium]
MTSQPFDPLAADYRSIQTLLAIMRELRRPVSGCPWDLEQSFETIAPYTIEEAYEVADAIERKDVAGLMDELGDLLLRVVYHAQMASEEQAFDFEDVVQSICRKMVRRHPHVFGDEKARSAGAAKGFWETMKSQEREQGIEQKQGAVLSGIPAALPALSRAVKLQTKAARVGFDWPSSE